MLEEQKVVFESFIETLAASIDARDKITAGHSSRVRMYSSLIAKKWDLQIEKLKLLKKLQLFMISVRSVFVTLYCKKKVA